jgi:hypothetical protein
MAHARRASDPFGAVGNRSRRRQRLPSPPARLGNLSESDDRRRYRPHRLPSNVGNYRRRGRKPTLQKSPSCAQLNYTLRIIQPVPLLALHVVRLELGILRAHGLSLSDHKENREGFPLTACPSAARRPPSGFSFAEQSVQSSERLPKPRVSMLASSSKHEAAI